MMIPIQILVDSDIRGLSIYDYLDSWGTVTTLYKLTTSAGGGRINNGGDLRQENCSNSRQLPSLKGVLLTRSSILSARC